MSAPVPRSPAQPRRPGLVAVPTPPPAPPAPQPAPPPTERDRLQANLVRVLAGLRWPAFRWEVLAEAEAWGVSGVVRNQLVPLPDGRYPSVEAVVEVLSAAARGRFRAAPPSPAVRPDRSRSAERAVAGRRRPVLTRRSGRRG